MPGSTSELNLLTAVDSDDNADYLTVSLANSLRTVDALFSNVGGHTHAGAHQGGPIGVIPPSSIAAGSITSSMIADGTITTVDLADGSVTAPKLAAGAVTTPAIASGVTLTNATVNALGPTVTGTGALVGANSPTLSSLTVTTAMTVTGTPGNWTATVQSANSGAEHGLQIQAGSSSSDFSLYVYNRATSQTFGYLRGDGYGNWGQSGQITWGPGATPATLASPTLNTPTISGAVTWGSPQSLPAVSTIVVGGTPMPIVGNQNNGGDYLIDCGSTGVASLPNGGAGNYSINFNRAFSTPPRVFIQLAAFSGAISNGLSKIGTPNVHNITTTGFLVDLDNQTGGSQGVVYEWFAFGH